MFEKFTRSEGRTPRIFTLHPDGMALYVLNEDGDSVVTIAVEPQQGMLGAMRAELRCGSPVCMIFKP